MARNSGSRFNRILEFIGLVDEPDDELERDRGRSGSTRTYNPSASKRDEGRDRTYRSQDRYGDYEPRDSRRYAADDDYDRPSSRQDYARSNRNGDYSTRTAQPRSDYRASSSAARNETRSRSGSYAGGGYTPSRGGDYASRAERPERDEFTGQPVRPRLEADERGRGNVVSLRGASAESSRSQTVIYYLRTLEECRDVINDLLDNKTVLLNLEDMDERLIQRGIDTLGGAAFALKATLRKASDKTYLIAPTTVSVAMTNDVERRY